MIRFVQWYCKVVKYLGKFLNWGCMALLGILALFTLVDVLGRSLMNKPVTGGYEITEILLTVMVALGLANSELLKKHVRVDLLLANLSAKVKNKVDLVNNLISCVIFILVGWRTILHADHLHNVGTTSGMLQMPIFHFVFVLGIGFVLLGGVFLAEFLDGLVKGS